MKCDLCNEGLATVVFTLVVEDEKKVLCLCPDCAHEKGLDGELFSHQEASEPMEPNTPAPESKEADDALSCPHCGLTYTRFKERYRLGCARCYDSFRERLQPLLRKVQGADTHTGKRYAGGATTAPEPAEPPSRKSPWTLELLKRRLQAAVEREEFEEAARLRDQIEAMKKTGSKE